MRTSVPRLADPIECECALEDLAGLAALLLDAAHSRDPDRSGVLVVAHMMEDIHTRLKRACNFDGGEE